MVGSAIYSNPVTVVTVWGDDATTTSKDGMLVSNQFHSSLEHKWS